jgi:two-component SAPR family response regulator
MSRRQRASNRNLAFFATQQKSLFTGFFCSIEAAVSIGPVFIVASDDKGVEVAKRAALRATKSEVQAKSFSALGFLQVPVSFREVAHRITDWIASTHKGAMLAVDMSWGLQTNSAMANFEKWMVVAEDLAERAGVVVASLYNRRLLIDEQLLVALRGHPAVLTSTGIVANPHALPAALLTRGTLREQVDHWLATISPEFEQTPVQAPFHAAEGADPMWLLRRAAEEPIAARVDRRERWKIRCFGRLRIYRNDGSQVKWDAPGGATRKSKTLFAYLLQKGGDGAATDELADLLWPESDSIETARNRLYHTVRCLRQALSSVPSGSDTMQHVLRDGSRYVLTPPQGSWIDISTFEQLCRQSQIHINAGAAEEALICLRAADRLYTGDLFEDIPPEYADDSERDWCWSKRYWLRDMFFKVQRDAARIYREHADYSAALAHCNKALAIDPLCEIAHEEAMKVFFAQGRREAIDRQYKLYLDSLSHFDQRPKSGAWRRPIGSFKRLRQPVRSAETEGYESIKPLKIKRFLG